MSFRGIFTAAALACAAVAAAPASASVTLTSETGNPGWLTANIVYTPGGIGGNTATNSLLVYAGRSHFTGFDNDSLAAVSFDAYCIDIFDYMNANGTTFAIGTLDHNPTAGALTTLLLSTASAIDAQTTLTAKQRVSAAIQLAAWEIVTEGAGNPYSLTGGLFQVNGGSVLDGATTSAAALAQSYLDGLGSATRPAGLRVLTLDPINPLGNQRQAFLAAVPEPSAWAMMIAGFGLVGGAMRSRRKTRIVLA